jgi:hypothetical protein
MPKIGWHVIITWCYSDDSQQRSFFQRRPLRLRPGGAVSRRRRTEKRRQGRIGRAKAYLLQKSQGGASGCPCSGTAVAPSMRFAALVLSGGREYSYCPRHSRRFPTVGKHAVESPADGETILSLPSLLSAPLSPLLSPPPLPFPLLSESLCTCENRRIISATSDRID